MGEPMAETRKRYCLVLPGAWIVAPGLATVAAFGVGYWVPKNILAFYAGMFAFVFLHIGILRCFGRRISLRED